ncbi:RNA exonuclease 4 [Capsicum annuum]|nr:RNA exonuclease 4 [Capsicum annuum]
MAHFIPCENSEDEASLASLFIENVVKLHGILRTIDRFPNQRKGKLLLRGDGPFQVLVRNNDNAYKIDLPPEYEVLNTFNVCDLSRIDTIEDEEPVSLRSNSSQDGEDDTGVTGSRPFTRSQARELQRLQGVFMKMDAVELVANSPKGVYGQQDRIRNRLNALHYPSNRPLGNFPSLLCFHFVESDSNLQLSNELVNSTYEAYWSEVSKLKGPCLLRDMSNIAKDFHVVQEEVAALIKGRILVGHALRNDFKALLLGHQKQDIRDTSEYKHFLREGRKRALRNLATEVLGVGIQNGEHCPIEDARAAMMLYLKHRKEWEKSIKDFARLKEKQKKRKPKKKNRRLRTVNNAENAS